MSELSKPQEEMLTKIKDAIAASTALRGYSLGEPMYGGPQRSIVVPLIRDGMPVSFIRIGPSGNVGLPRILRDNIGGPDMPMHCRNCCINPSRQCRCRCHQKMTNGVERQS